MTLLQFLDGLKHYRRKGHWPDWLELGDYGPIYKSRECIVCIYGKGGSRQRLIFSPVAARG